MRSVVNRGGTEGALDLTGRRELGGAQRTLDVRGLDGRWRMVGSGTEGRRRWERNVWRVREMWLPGLARCSEAKLHKSTTMRVDGFAMGAEVEVDGIFGIVSLAFTPDQAQVITNMIRNLLECVCTVEVLSELEDVGKRCHRSGIRVGGGLETEWLDEQCVSDDCVWGEEWRKRGR